MIITKKTRVKYIYINSCNESMKNNYLESIKVIILYIENKNVYKASIGKLFSSPNVILVIILLKNNQKDHSNLSFFK